MKQKVFVGLVSPDFPFVIRPATLDLDGRALFFKRSFRDQKQEGVVPENVAPLPFKTLKGKGVMFLFNVKTGCAVNYGSTEGIIDDTLRARLYLACRQKMWNAAHGRAMDTLELLVLLAAGGFIGLILEMVIKRIFGGGG